MKNIIAICLFFTVALAGVFAQEQEQKGFSVTVDIDTNLVQYKHTDFQNDEYQGDTPIPDADQVHFLSGTNYDDVTLDVSYNDPEGRFGLNVGIEIPALLTPSFLIGDVYAWGKVFGVFREKLGKYTDRVVEKIGGDMDLGVFSLEFTDDNALTIGSTDSLGLGSNIIGSLSTVFIGPVEASVFFAPNEYHVSKILSMEGTNTGAKVTVDSYYSYLAGGSVKYRMDDFLTVGAAYRQAHTRGEGTSTGYIFNDFGLYGIVNNIANIGLTVGVGYSGQLSFEDGDELDSALYQNAIHLDVKYTGIEKLTIGLYNNMSFYTLGKEYTPGFDAAINAIVPDAYADETGLVLYNELEAGYRITDIIGVSLKARNYYATITGRNGANGQDYGINKLLIEPQVVFTISKNALFRAGVNFEAVFYNTPAASVILRNNSFAVGVPIGLTVSY